MSETQALFDTLHNSADKAVVAAIESVVENGADRELCRINVLMFAAKHGLDAMKKQSVGSCMLPGWGYSS